MSVCRGVVVSFVRTRLINIVQRGHKRQLVFAEDAADRGDLDTLATLNALLGTKERDDSGTR
jgi:hypothetical protein